ncbi:MAG TPA: hypothetical protein PLV68_10410, partial [Ilumatobacteraceae bacterium]|nr:hypothetical protein [Ilumatobacteraceae bacterium]
MGLLRLRVVPTRLRPIDVTSAAITVAAVTVAVSQRSRRARWRLIAIAQSFTPMLGVAAAANALAAVLRRRRVTAIVNTCAALALAAVVAPALTTKRPRRWGDDDPRPGESETGLRVAHANLLYQATDDARAAIGAVLATDADVLALTEFTLEHEAALAALDTDHRYRYCCGQAVSGA